MGCKQILYCRVPYIDLDPIADFLETDYDYDYDDFKRRKKRSPSGKVELGFDPSIDLYPGDYCNLIKDLSEERCLENSLLELWSEDNYGEETDAVLNNLNQQDVIDAVNNQTFSKTLGFDQDFSKYLGEVTRNQTGHIVGAKATFIRFFGRVNVSAITSAELSSSSKGSPVDRFTLRWETELIETLTTKLGNHSGFELFPNVAKSFSDLSSEAIEGDAFIFGCGTAIMFIYVQLMLGKFNFVEQRPGLSSVGICCCFLGLLTSYGICSGVGLVFSPMHAIIPFLFVGIGIDDMFVIVQCHSNLAKTEAGKDLSLLEMMGLTLKHAGVVSRT